MDRAAPGPDDVGEDVSKRFRRATGTVSTLRTVSGYATGQQPALCPAAGRDRQGRGATTPDHNTGAARIGSIRPDPRGRTGTPAARSWGQLHLSAVCSKTHRPPVFHGGRPSLRLEAIHDGTHRAPRPLLPSYGRASRSTNRRMRSTVNSTTASACSQLGSGTTAPPSL